MPPEAQRTFAIMEGRNEIVAARIRHGLGTAVARLLLRMTPQLGRGLSQLALGLLTTAADAAGAREKRRRALLHFSKVAAALGGLRGPGYDRPVSKTGRLVEIAETAPAHRQRPVSAPW
jgi:hypothetical protein